MLWRYCVALLPALLGGCTGSAAAPRAGPSLPIPPGDQARGRDVMGTWIDDSPMVGGTITLFRLNDRAYFEQVFKDGSVYTIEIRESRSPLGRRFDKVDPSRAGDHWIIGPTGELLIRDNEGPIATAQPLARPGTPEGR